MSSVFILTFAMVHDREVGGRLHNRLFTQLTCNYSLLRTIPPEGVAVVRVIAPFGYGFPNEVAVASMHSAPTSMEDWLEKKEKKRGYTHLDPNRGKR